MAWHVARYLERVAAAGRAEYDLPMFANAWLASPNDVPGRYPSGGPVATMLDVWRAAAPHLDFFAPDIYLPAFRQLCARYHRPGNPLFIPEMSPAPGAAARTLYAFGQHQALGCSPFGIEDQAVDSPLTDCYDLLTEMMPLLCARKAPGAGGPFAAGGRRRMVLGWTALLSPHRHPLAELPYREEPCYPLDNRNS